MFYKTKSGCRFGEKCSYAHRQVDEKPSKRSKNNDDKSAVAMLKKCELHDRTWQLVVNRDKSHDSAELETLTKSCSPTIVITANGEVQTQEEAIVYVKELDMFLTMKVLEDQ